MHRRDLGQLGARQWTPKLLPIDLNSISTFGEDVRGNLYLGNGGSVYRLTDPDDVFTDGFESGTVAAWQ